MPAADWLISHIDEGEKASECSDDRKIETAFFATGWQELRKVFRGCSFDAKTLKQTTNWTWFPNGKLKTLTTKNGSGAILESHTVGYEEGGVYVNRHRTEDVLMAASAARCLSTEQAENEPRVRVPVPISAL